MKKRIKLFASLFATALFSLAACDKKKTEVTPNPSNENGEHTNPPIVEPIKKTYTVTFDSKGGTNINSATVDENGSVNKPTDPTKNGYVFDGWYLDETFTNKMDFSNKINSNITLYAKWRAAETLPVDTYYTVTFNTNGGSTITSVEVLENTKVSKPSDPTKDGYKFVGWFTDSGLTSEMNFDNPIKKATDLYAKWEKIVDNTTYGIVDRDFKIPTDLTFSSELHTSANHTTINCGSLNSSGNYSQNFDKEGDAKTIGSVKVIKYRYNISGGNLNLLADNSYYNGTPYHGREGTLFNTAPLGGINKIEIAYSANYSSSNNKGYQFESNELIKPNIRFGNDPSCCDYVYFLNPSSASETCNVNLSGYKYFSVCSGSYTLSVSTIDVYFDNNSVSTPTYAPVSGKNKVRVNPARYTYSLVPGESKITIPLKTEFNQVTNTYIVTESKELTYYTTDYVRNHPNCKDDAAIIDPILIASYYTAFGKWPANFASNKGSVKNIFDDKARQVSTYDRTDGYVRAVPWNFTGKYYEFDIDLDGSYSSSRGSGRVVAWESGWSADGYDNAPVCIYTDDHYNTFLEYLNNGTWSSRFNAEGVVAGIKYSTAPTVSLTGFDPHVVEGTSSGEGGGGETGDVIIDEEKVINDNEYYANFAPIDLINDKTALYQQVTNRSGIKEGNKYLITYMPEEIIFPYSGGAHTNNSNHSLRFDYPDDIQYLRNFYFEVASDKTGYIYYYSYGEKVYMGCNSSNPKDVINGNKTLFTFGFDAYGNFNLIAYGKYLRFFSNSTSNGFRFYNYGVEKPIQLYRFCDIEGATPFVETYSDQEFELINSAMDINSEDGYVIVSENYQSAFFSGGKFVVDSETLELKMTEESYANTFTLEKHPDYDYYAINSGFLYVIYRSDYNHLDLDSEPLYYDIQFDEGIAKFIPMSLDGDEPEPLLNDGKPLFIYCKNANGEFGCTTEESNVDIRLYKFIKPEPQAHYFYTSVGYLSSECDLLLVSADGKKCLTDNGDAVYNAHVEDGYLDIEGTPDYKVIHFNKHETEDMYSISYEVNGETKYIHTDVNTYEVSESDEPCYYKVTIYGDATVQIEPMIIQESTGQYISIRTQEEVCLLNYDMESGEFKLCRWDNGAKLYLFEVNVIWF